MMLKRREERKLLRKEESCYDNVEGDEGSKQGWGVVGQRRVEDKSHIIRNGVLEHTYYYNSSHHLGWNNGSHSHRL